MSSATTNLAAIVAWCGFGLGFVFGAVANKVNFCTMGSVSDVVNMGDWGRMRMWLLAIAVAMLGAVEEGAKKAHAAPGPDEAKPKR